MVSLGVKAQQSGKLTEWKLNKQLFQSSTTNSRRKRKAKSGGAAMRVLAALRQEARGEQMESESQSSAITIRKEDSASLASYIWSAFLL